MAGSLSYDYRWNPLSASFSDSNSMAANGMAALSNVGDIFSKLSDRIAAREAKRTELALKERQMEQAALQFDAQQALEREKLANTLGIAQMNDATDRWKANLQNQRYKDNLNYQIDREKRAADAALAAKNRMEQMPETLRLQYEDILNREKALGGERFPNNAQLLMEQQQKMADAQKRFDSASESVAGSALSDLTNDPFGYIFDKKKYVENRKSEKDLAAEELSALRQGYDKLLAETQSDDYVREREKYLREKAFLDEEKKSVALKMAMRSLPQFRAGILAEEQALRGLNPAEKNMVPNELDYQLQKEFIKNLTGGKSGKSSSGGSGSSGGEFNKTYGEILSKMGKNTKDWKQDDWIEFDERVAYYKDKGEPDFTAIVKASMDTDKASWIGRINMQAPQEYIGLGH